MLKDQSAEMLKQKNAGESPPAFFESNLVLYFVHGFLRLAKIFRYGILLFFQIEIVVSILMSLDFDNGFLVDGKLVLFTERFHFRGRDSLNT